MALLLSSVSAPAQIMESLSSAAYWLGGNQACSQVSTNVNRALDDLEQKCSVHGGVGSQAQGLGRIAAAIDDPEDRLFKVLGKEHAKELKCSADFAGRAASDPEVLKDLKEKTELLRLARREVLDATQRLMNNPLATKICPLSIEELQPTPGMALEHDATFVECKKIITSRQAVNSILSAIPLSNVPPLKEFLDRHMNGRGSDSLDEDLKKAYLGAQENLSKESDRLNSVADTQGGKGFDRTARGALMSDPLVVKNLLEKSNRDPDMEALLCRADARYLTGAANLDTGLFVGSLILGGGSALALRAGGVGAGLVRGAQVARSRGLISMSGTRILQASAAAVSATAAYSEIDKQCGATAAPRMGAQGNSCVSAPKIEDLAHDNCVLTLALTAAGFAVQVPPNSAAKILARLRGRTASADPELASNVAARPRAPATPTPDPLPPRDWEATAARFRERFRTDLVNDADLPWGQQGLVKPPADGQPSRLLLSQSMRTQIEREIALGHEGHHVRNLANRLDRGNDRWAAMSFGRNASPVYRQGYWGEEITAHYAGGLRGEQLARKYEEAGDLVRAREARQFSYLSYSQGRTFVTSSRPMVNQALEKVAARGPAAFDYNRNTGQVVMRVMSAKNEPVDFRFRVSPNLSMAGSANEALETLNQLQRRLDSLDSMYVRRIDKLRPYTERRN